MRYLVSLVWLAIFGASAGAAVGQSIASGSEPAAFRAGDVVRVTVWQNPEFSGEFDIGADGTVIHPLYRTIRIAGLSVPEAEAEFRAVLERYEMRPQLVIEPLFRVAVTGEVGAPNVYLLSPRTTAVQAIAQAGGPTEDAKVSAVRLLRGGQELRFDLTRPYREIDHIRLRTGDQIILEHDRSVWRDYIHPAITTAGSLATIAWAVLRITDQGGIF